MLVIRTAQLRALDSAAEADFARRLAAHVAIRYPGPCRALGEEGTRAFAGRVIAAGTGNGVDTEGGLTALAELMIQVGERFERLPDGGAWARDVLAHPTLPGALKVNALVQRIVSRTQGRVVEPS